MYRVEMHTHVYPVFPDSSLDADKIMEVFKETGYSGVVSNHYYIGALERVENNTVDNLKKFHVECIKHCKEVGEKYGIKVYTGVKYHVRQHLHFGLIGLTEDMILSLPAPEQSFDDIYNWCVVNDVLLINNHPYREDYECMVHYEIRYELVSTKRLDLMEAQERDCSNATRHFASIYVCGGDIYHKEHIGRGAMMFNKLPEDERELLHLIRNLDYSMDVPMDISSFM